MTREVMQQALDALENHSGNYKLTLAECVPYRAAANAELLEALQKADEFIDGIREDLHHERAADWYPEGASSAALSMSENMRLIGNRCADFNATKKSITALREALAQPAKPLTQREVIDGFCKLPHEVQYVKVFEAGVRFAEAAHNIKEQ